MMNFKHDEVCNLVVWDALRDDLGNGFHQCLISPSCCFRELDEVQKAPHADSCMPSAQASQGTIIQHGFGALALAQPMRFG